MRIINKKYLLVILLIGIILTGVVIFRPKENIKLDNVILKQEINNKTMAMYTETDNGYEEYEGNTFPKGQRLNKSLSKCVDKNGEEIEDVINVNNENGNIGIRSNKSLSCYLYFDNKIEDLSGNGNNGINHAQLWTEEGIATSIDANNLGYIDCGFKNYDFQNTMTMITRVKFNDIIGDQYLFGNWQYAGGGISLRSYTLNFQIFDDSNSYVYAKKNYNFNQNVYYTIVGVCDGNTIAIYINGEKISSQEISGNIKPSTLPIFLGSNPEPNGTATWHSYTTFTDTLLFDSALSDEEIQEYFSGEIDKDKVLDKYVNNESDQDLLLYYKFD